MLTQNLIAASLFSLLTGFAHAAQIGPCAGQAQAEKENRVLVQESLPTVEIDRGGLSSDFVGGAGIITLGDPRLHSIRYKARVSAARAWFGRKPQRETLEFLNYQCRKPSDLTGTYSWDPNLKVFRNEKNVQLHSRYSDSGLSQTDEISIQFYSAEEIARSPGTWKLFENLMLVGESPVSETMKMEKDGRVFIGLGATETQIEALKAMPVDEALEFALNSLPKVESERSSFLFAKLMNSISVDHEIEMTRAFENMDQRKQKAMSQLLWMALTPDFYSEEKLARQGAGRVLGLIINPANVDYVLTSLAPYLESLGELKSVQLNNAVYLGIVIEKVGVKDATQILQQKRLLALLKGQADKNISDLGGEIRTAGMLGDRERFQRATDSDANFKKLLAEINRMSSGL